MFLEIRVLKRIFSVGRNIYTAVHHGPQNCCIISSFGGPFSLSAHLLSKQHQALPFTSPVSSQHFGNSLDIFKWKFKKTVFFIKIFTEKYLMKYFNKIFLKVNFPNYRFLIPRLPTDSTEELFFIQVSYPYFFHPSFLSLYTFKAIFDNELLK